MSWYMPSLPLQRMLGTCSSCRAMQAALQHTGVQAFVSVARLMHSLYPLTLAMAPAAPPLCFAEVTLGSASQDCNYGPVTDRPI